MDDNIGHMDYLSTVCNRDMLHLQLKESTYKGSWKKRGGVGAFMMLARKWDRIENMAETTRMYGEYEDTKYDIFGIIQANPNGEDGTLLAEIRDLRRYLILVEAEMMARGIVDAGRGNAKEDSNKHAFQAEESVHSGERLGSRVIAEHQLHRRGDRD